jgi:hypothetical protein
VARRANETRYDGRDPAAPRLDFRPPAATHILPDSNELALATERPTSTEIFSSGVEASTAFNGTKSATLK